MIRLLLLLGLFFLVIKSFLWFLKILGQYRTIQNVFKNAYSNSNTQCNQTTAGVSSMVKCSHCGLYVPENQAIISNMNYFCCSDHIKR